MRFIQHLDNIKGCIFDLDGTLLDSMSVWQEVDRKYLKKFSIEFKPEYSDEIKKITFDENATYFINKFNLDLSEEQIKADWYTMVEEEYAQHIPMKKGALALLEHMHSLQIPMCIATSCHKPHALLALKRLGIDKYFDFIFTCKELNTNKHCSDIFLTCAEKFEILPTECMVVEDLFVALQVCHKEGFVCVGVHDQLSAHEREDIREVVDYYIEDFETLLHD